MINQFYIDYIKAIENPDRVGWNGKVWTAPQYKGYDKNQRGYGIDIVKNDSAKRLTQNRPGQWLTEKEADKLMREHLLYVYGAAQKHIEGFDNLSDRRKAALLGMLYRGDSVNKNRHIIDINEPDDNKFFESINNYYRSKGLNERARNSSKFFNNNQLQLTNFLIPMKWEQWEPPMKFKSGGQVRKMLTAAGGPIKKPIKRLKDGYRYIPDEQNGGWNRISDNSMADVFATMEFTPNKTRTGSSITRTLQPKTSNYRSAYNPDDIIKGFNILTLGGLNNLSPTLWARRVYDTGKLLNGDMTWSGYTNSWINGNNGLVSLKFSKEHPYLSTGINLVGDAVALGGISGAKKLTNISRPNVNVAADIGTSVEQKIPALSLEEIEKAFNQAKQWHLNRINSPGYKDRALRAGFTEEEIPQLLQLLTRLINSLKLQNKEKLFPNNFSYEDNFGKINAEYWRLPTNKGMFLGIGFYNPNMSYDEAVSKFIHEFGHGATFGLNGNETTGLAGKLSKQFPLITKAVLYNKSLFPEVTEETVKKVFPYAAENGKLEYYSRPTELLARGYEFMRDYGNSWWKLKNSGNSFTNLDAMNNAANSRLNSKLFRGLTGNSGAYNFQKNALGISVPLGLGYGLYNNDNLLQQLQYLKQGGKMNVLKLFKKGGYIRKMLTAAGGPLRLKFTPEQIAYFESRGLPLGMNNSKNYREEGALALLYQELEKARKEKEIASRMEMKPVLVKKASRLGEKDLYKLQVNTAAGVVSPVDPVAEFLMYGNPTLKGVGALSKTGLWNVAKYAPRTQLGNYGRLYFVGNAFKNSSLGEPFISRVGVPIEEGYMYHTYQNPYPGFVRNGVHWNMERRPGSVGIKDGKYYSNRFKTDSLNDRIWWDINGHNVGDNILVTKEGGFKINDPKSLAKPFGGVYYNSYRTTPRIETNKVIQFKYDPIAGYTITRNPFRQISTNKMSIRELFIPESTKPIQEPSTSLAFFERKPSKPVTREYVQSPKDITSDVGNLIAEGSERSVYASKSNPNIVYKIEDAPLDDIKNIKIRKEVTDDIIAPETTVGYYNRNGKYYRVTLLDKYKSWDPDDFDINYSPELDLEIIDVLRKAKWNVELGTYNGAPYARTASKNGIKIGNLEYFNWGRDSNGNLKLIDLYVTKRNPSTIQISPEELYKVLKDQELNGYYFMGHGTGRTNVNPLIIFDNGLRIKNGDIGNTTIPISLSNLSLWPHANSKEVIILPGKAENVKFDAARGRIPSDWYDSKTFQWDDNPGFEGSGFFAALKPNATFVETEINGVPGVYTKPEAILGSYNIDTQTLKLNPRSLYNFFKKQGGKMNILEFLKNGGYIRKMQTAAGGPLINESTRVEKPIAVFPKKINKSQLSDDNSWERTNNNNEVNVYPNLRNDKYVQEFFLYDYAPRFKRLNNFASQDYVNTALNIYKNTPINIYNENNNVGGYQTGGERKNFNNFLTKLINPSYIPSSIYLNEKFKLNRPTLVHELTHAFRLRHLGITGDARFSSVKRPLYNAIGEEIGNGYFGSGYSDSEKNILNNTYNMNGYKINYDPLYEKGTTNTEVRFRLWKELYDQLGRRPSLEETDKYIRTYDGEKLLRIIRNANAYGRTMYDNGMLINLIKNALINVAQNNSNNAYLLNDQTYYAKQGGVLEFLKNGSGIHIKKKNRGSFTRWCGGNVTEECIRRGKASSNPKIRKKATFADNARHFKHKKGGKAFVEGVNVLDSNPNAYKHVKKKIKMRLYGGPLEYLFKEAQYLKWANDYLNPTVINYNPDIDANRNFKFNNSILQLTDEYNNLKLLEAEKINNEVQRYSSFLSKGLELLFGYLNKPKTISNNSTNFSTNSWSKVNKDLAGTSYIKPDTNNKLFTSNVIGSNMNVTYDDMRNLIMQ